MFFNNKYNIEITTSNLYNMILVTIKKSQVACKTIDIDIIIPNPSLGKIVLQLPAWRPGRYEMQNFAKNITYLTTLAADGLGIDNCKVTKDSWEIEAQGHHEIKVSYGYYANQMDAGGSYMTEEMLYINFINCIFYVVGRIEDAYQIHIELDDAFQIACGLPTLAPHVLRASSFYELVDSPMIVSRRLQSASYVVENTNFTIWIEGEHGLAMPALLADFEKFTQTQFNIFKSFPFEQYHFLLLFLPYQHYHGVEHHNSTVIVLGPDYKIARPALYKELLGISCHELFHAWNALQIKPKELSPYDFTKENYFDTGFVLEGFTTYYGDYLLARAGIWSVDQYMHELNAILKREFDNFGSQTASLSRSSVELWLDGYVQGIPNRKVSIYTKGCLFALLLDLSLRASTNNTTTLDKVMLELWERFGKTKRGYVASDIVHLVNEISGQDFKAFFDLSIFSAAPLQSFLHQKLAWVGCQLLCSESVVVSENYFGFRVSEKEGKCNVDYCEPGSEAALYLAKNDEIIAVNGKKVIHNLQDLLVKQSTIHLTLFRDSVLKTIVLSQHENRYFKQYTIVPLETMSIDMKNNFQLWLS